MATICGGTTIGIGMGIVLRYGASTGGLDIIAIVANHRKGLPLGTIMYSVDISVLIMQILFVDTFEQIIMGILLTVISNQHEKIRAVLSDQGFGITELKGKTGYLQNEIDVLIFVSPKQKALRIKNEVLAVDPQAFITISSIKEVRGRGYSFDI